MPLVNVAMLQGRSGEYISDMLDSIHAALVESYQMPDGDRFQRVDQYEPGCFVFDPDYYGPRSGQFLLITISAGSRTTEVKEAFYKTLVKKLARAPGIRPEDVFVSLNCNAAPEDWSFSGGQSAADLIRQR